MSLNVCEFDLRANTGFNRCALYKYLNQHARPRRLANVFIFLIFDVPGFIDCIKGKILIDFAHAVRYLFTRIQ